MNYLLGILGCVIVLFVSEIVREIHTFRVTQERVISPKLSKTMPEMKIAVLSDLHNCEYGKKNEKLLKALRDESPDLILVAGDMLVGLKDTSTEIAEEFVKQAVQIAPVFYGNGNHEQRMKEIPEEYGDVYAEYRSHLLDEGVAFLENESAEFYWYGEKIAVTGFELSLTYYKKFKNHNLTVREMEQKIGASDKEGFQILIAHNPVYGEVYAEWGADLTISGHLHGGIVRLPFLGGVITPQVKLLPKYSGGKYRVGSGELVVSKGLGVHTIPIRLFNEPELVILHIKGRK